MKNVTQLKGELNQLEVDIKGRLAKPTEKYLALFKEKQEGLLNSLQSLLSKIILKVGKFLK